MGDRLQQSVDGGTTTFTLDLNNSLTQVLADGTNNYLYGLDRIAQSSLTTEYFLTDALGSARQLVDASGAVQSAASYEPFGAPITNGASSYGFAGEWQDPTGLVYLRARFYSPELGIFLSRDPFPGFLTQPASLTPYQYAFNNPVRYTDPSGENPLLLVGLLGGLLGGAIYGYGSQVLRNYNSGEFSECPWDIFTANIDAGQIALYTVAGMLLGLGITGAWVGIQALWTAYTGITTTGVWTYSWWSRGQIIEDWLGRNLPRNFPTIDRFENGIATSIKSLNIGAPTYQNIGALISKVQGYINSVATFQGAYQISSNMITGRMLELVIPSGTATPQQWAALNTLFQYAAALNVTFNVIQIP